MLQLRGFAGSPGKVKLLEFHPVQPWICYADTTDRVRVWDWTTQQTLHDLQLGGADDEGSMEAALNSMPAKDTAFTTNPSAISHAPSRVPSGHIRQVRFLDPEVAYWQTATQHQMVNGSSSNPPSAANVHALDGTRLLVVVCENKLLLYDLNTRKPYEVSRAVLDGKAPSCVAFLFRGGRFSPGGQPEPSALMTSPVLAVGCADGVVRLLHLATLRVVGRLSGSHKAGITTLLTLPSRADFKQSTDQQAAAAAQQQQQQQQQQQGVKGKTPRQSSERGAAAAAAAGQEGPLVFLPSVDLVLAGDSSGSMFLWSPFSTPLGSAEREVAPRLSFTGHSGEVWALCLTPGPEDPRHTAPKVFSAGADHRLVAWDALSLKEVWRTKLEAKAPLTSLTYSQRYFNLSGAHALLATNNGPGVVAAYTLSQMPPEKGLRACANLAGLVPPGTKKVPKAYVVAVSPVRPNLAAVGANTGMAFMTFDRMYPLPVAGLPLTNLAAAHDSPALRLPREPVAAAYVAHMGDAVWLVNCTAVEKDVGGVSQVVPEVLSAQQLGPAVGRTGRAIVGVSHGGEYVSVCWPASRGYVVYYRTLAGTWTEVDSGLGVDLAWHSHRDVFAVLEEPPPTPPAVGKPKKKRGKDSDKWAAAEAAALAASMAAATVVRIKALDGLGVYTTCHQVSLSGDVPCGLHGGPLLGVALKRLTSSGAELSGEDASPVLQFYSWNGVSKVGPELPEPGVVAWDPTLRYLALAYLRQVQVLRAQPTLEVLGCLPIVGTTAAVWGVRQLYVATPTSILLAFVAAEEAQPPGGAAGGGAAGAAGGAAAGGGLDLLDGPLAELAASSSSSKQGSQSTLQFIQLAGLTGTTATSRLRAASSGRDACLPGPAPRPPGPLALLGPRQGNLWCVNALGQPLLLPLTHPGIWSRCLCAQGDLVGAVAVGRKGLAPCQHDSLAGFLALQGGGAGAHLALLGLQGLSLDMEAELCMVTGQWRRACVCVEALMRGCSDRAALSSREAYAASRGPEAAAAAAGDPAGDSLLASLGVTAPLATPGQLAAASAVSAAGGSAVEPAPAPQKQQQQMWGHMGFGGLFIDNYQLPPDAPEPQEDKAHDLLAAGMLAWASPLTHDWAPSSAPRQVSTAPADTDASSSSGGYAAFGGAATAAAGLVAAATAVAAAAQPPPASALGLAMRLVEGSQAAGITDVTRRASQLLLAHRGLLTPPQLARLAAKMAEVGMSPELRDLVDSSGAYGSHAGQAVGFVAAALTGDLELLQRSLQHSGTDALAALQANTYRLPSALATEQAWNGALQHIGSMVAAHQTNSYAYYGVTQSGL